MFFYILIISIELYQYVNTKRRVQMLLIIELRLAMHIYSCYKRPVINQWRNTKFVFDNNNLTNTFVKQILVFWLIDLNRVIKHNMK